jgi:hypothetical protein
MDAIERHHDDLLAALLVGVGIDGQTLGDWQSRPRNGGGGSCVTMDETSIGAAAKAFRVADEAGCTAGRHLGSLTSNASSKVVETDWACRSSRRLF